MGVRGMKAWLYHVEEIFRKGQSRKYKVRPYCIHSPTIKRRAWPCAYSAVQEGRPPRRGLTSRCITGVLYYMTAKSMSSHRKYSKARSPYPFAKWGDTWGCGAAFYDNRGQSHDVATKPAEWWNLLHIRQYVQREGERVCVCAERERA